MLSRLAAVALAISAMALPSLAAPPMTKLRVEVHSPSDKPVERASVIVRFIEGRSVVKLGKQIRTNWELKTNQDGVAVIPPIPQGKIRVQIIAKNYQTFGQVYEVNEEEKTIEIKLNPPQAQFSAHE
ncbi:MAG: carboxypeptidase-like regulatory domain-containing protein [Bryobacteraceae bacterium]